MTICVDGFRIETTVRGGVEGGFRSPRDWPGLLLRGLRTGPSGQEATGEFLPKDRRKR